MNEKKKKIIFEITEPQCLNVEEKKKKKNQISEYQNKIIPAYRFMSRKGMQMYSCLQIERNKRKWCNSSTKLKMMTNKALQLHFFFRIESVWNSDHFDLIANFKNIIYECVGTATSTVTSFIISSCCWFFFLFYSFNIITSVQLSGHHNFLWL